MGTGHDPNARQDCGSRQQHAGHFYAVLTKKIQQYLRKFPSREIQPTEIARDADLPAFHRSGQAGR
jgi:hypothetical protein